MLMISPEQRNSGVFGVMELLTLLFHNSSVPLFSKLFISSANLNLQNSNNLVMSEVRNEGEILFFSSYSFFKIKSAILNKKFHFALENYETNAINCNNNLDRNSPS